MSYTKKEVIAINDKFLIKECNDEIALVYNEEDLPLFLAAPDLLDALTDCYNNTDVNESMPDWILQKVEQAINKAEGKNHGNKD